jgi:predicted NBD/HSP70 family sugar kinase
MATPVETFQSNSPLGFRGVSLIDAAAEFTRRLAEIMTRKTAHVRAHTRLDLLSTPMASSETARNMNRDVVLELIRLHQPLSRAELSRLSGLQRSTISLITEQLIRERWVCEGSIAKLPRGRRPTLLGLNEGLAMLAVDVRAFKATLAVVNLNGSLMERSELDVSGDPLLGIRKIAEELVRLRAHHPALAFEGVGISLPGRVDPETQALIFAPNLRWQGQPIKQMVEQITGLSAELENAANAALLAELWLGNLDGVRNAVLVDISEGIGVGMLANGQLITGLSGMAGEFGHVPLESTGPRCGCGLLGCWEMFASTDAALRYFREGAGQDNASRSVDTFEELLQRAFAGEADALSAIEKQARAVGRGLRTVNAGLSPEVIIIAGDVTGAWELYRPHLEAALGSLSASRPPRLIPTETCDLTRLHGAAAIVLQRNSLFRSYR